MSLRILITGSREWADKGAIAQALLDAFGEYGPFIDYDEQMGRLTAWQSITLVHGAARGADAIADRLGEAWGLTVERHRARDFPTPLLRNQHMVDLGADVCLAFAQRWASGTGNCARAARKAGIHTVDYGVPTALEDRP